MLSYNEYAVPNIPLTGNPLSQKKVLSQNLILAKFTMCFGPTLLVFKMVSLVILLIYGPKRDARYCHFGRTLHIGKLGRK